MNVNPTEFLPVFAANYAKRSLEYLYDNAFKTPLGQRFLTLGTAKKYAVEFFLNALSSFFELRFKESTSLRKFAKELVTDAAPEVSKRLINGAKHEIEESAKTLEEKELARLLLELEDKDLLGLLNWLYGKGGLEIRTISFQLSRLSPEEIAKLMNLSVDDREKFFGLLNPRSRPKKDRGLLGMMADDINELNERIEKSHRKET